VKRKKRQNENIDSLFSNSEKEEEEEEISKIKTSRPAREYKVTQINGNFRASTSLALVVLSIGSKKGKKPASY